ncbi:MAG: hypothetical protein JSV41_00370 [Gemmatimonadota bacterium]|nr:MAG: hypothetical protein JSV41_00370 [Gemmatimonadota bacterium]
MVTDIYAALPAVIGKLELEYEGELHGSEKIARDLISRAAGATSDEYFLEQDAAPIMQYFTTVVCYRVAKRSINHSDSGSYTRRRERPRPSLGHGLRGTSWPHEI